MLAMMLSGLTVLLLDLAAKRVVERRGTNNEVRVGPVATIRHVASRKRIYSYAAFRVILFVVWILALVSALLLAASGHLSTPIARTAIGAALGGAAGNLYDIVKSHSVRDYIDLGWWPVFNLADVAILGGLALAFIRG